MDQKTQQKWLSMSFGGIYSKSLDQKTQQKWLSVSFGSFT